MARRAKKHAGRLRRYVRRHATRKGGMNAGRLLMRSAKDSVALAGARRLPDFAGTYQGALDKIIAGGALKVFRQGGSALIEVGIAEAGANLIDGFIIPAVGGMISGGLAKQPAGNGGQRTPVYNMAAVRA